MGRSNEQHLPVQEGEYGDCVFVVPSLEKREMEGKFMLHLASTHPIEVEQVH